MRASQRHERGYAFRGTVWPGGGTVEYRDAVVVIDATGCIARLGPACAIAIPEDLPTYDVGWIGPGIVDAHVHMGFGSLDEQLSRGVLAVRDLGAPAPLLAGWRAEHRAAERPLPDLFAAGQLLTAPGGYPSQSWGKAGYALFIDGPQAAVAAVAELTRDYQADVIKIALEPSGGAPVPDLDTVRAVVRSAHTAGYAVTCHALSVEMVERALAAGVDELCHTPVEPLPEALVARIVKSGTVVTSTLHTFVAGGAGDGAVRNAKALIAAGASVVYGTDLGNAGTTEGIDVRELRHLAEAGLGIKGALRAATEGAARAPGFSGFWSGRLEVGQTARMIGLASSPLSSREPWKALEAAPLVAKGPWVLP